ncbi:hypothetical protein BDQ12DRAFT_718662 [Crucibulum laeve]|uniref:Uncharacterized protein n=1 Tax=Crucibulum laeve TaxID=68775 RepID=A0A5C3MDP6_9AGAR|nr:hypothetical protein BDQ12DRAFT_718662 [Crucibulum laeve]
MRRIASLFASKRDKSDSEHAINQTPHDPKPSLLARSSSNLPGFKKKQPPSLSIASPLPPPPAFSPATPTSIASTPQLSDPAHSSASSSGSASLSIRTPDDDHVTLERSSTKRSWKTWLGSKRAASLNKHVPKPDHQDSPVQDWHPRHPPAFSRPPLPGNRAVSHQPEDSEQDTTSESDAESEVLLEPALTTTASSAAPSSRLQNLRISPQSSLTPPLPSSPFVQHASQPLFPRSCNRPQELLPQPTMLSAMLKSHTLRRLQDPESRLNYPDEVSMLSFTNRSTPAVNDLPTGVPFNEPRPSNPTKIFKSSPGLRSWISRPCFEDRFIIFLPTEGDILRWPVTSSMAVAALEYSEVLDAMVDPDFDATFFPSSEKVMSVAEIEVPSPGPVQHPAGDALHQSSHTQTRGSTYIGTPSPLRNQHVSPASSSTASPIVSMSVLSLPSSASTVKRIVRFAEDDDEDGTPLHILRMKKKREEKARFLRREQVKRLAEEDQVRRLQELEEQRQREELVEREQRRLAREKERKEMERRLYQEEVAASRLRREMHRAGGVPSVNSSNNLLVPSASTTSLAEPERNRHRESRRYSQAPSLPRRETSDNGYLAISTSQSHIHQQGSSSGSSRPPSGAYSPASANHSRPASTYSAQTQSSSEDVRPSGGSRRGSYVASAAGSSHRPQPDRAWSMPLWAGSNQSLQPVPPVPPMPYLYMHDGMPLLPPTAPFMMQQRPSRNSSPGPSTSSGSRRGGLGSANSSAERVNQLSKQNRPQQHRQSSASPRHSASPSPASSSPHRSTHERHPSGGSRRSSMPVSQHHDRGLVSSSQTQTQAQTLSRGRAPHPGRSSSAQQLQMPSPWTALPSQYGTLPQAMPVSPYSHSNIANLSRR